MLDVKDLQAIKGIVEEVVDERVSKVEIKVDKLDERISKVETKVEQLDQRISTVEENMDRRFTKTENLILKYVDDTRVVLENKIIQVQRNLDELNQYYRLTKLENENGTLYLQLIKELRKDVDELKEKTA